MVLGSGDYRGQMVTGRGGYRVGVVRVSLKKVFFVVSHSNLQLQMVFCSLIVTV